MAEVKFEQWKYKAENAKSCPYCGSNSVSVTHKQRRFIGYNGIGFKKITMQAYCICNKCHAKGKPIKYIGYEASHSFYDSEHLPLYSCGDKAIEAWNNRATEAELRANVIDEFAEAMKKICAERPLGTDREKWIPLYVHEDGTWHSLIDDVVAQMKGEKE